MPAMQFGPWLDTGVLQGLLEAAVEASEADFGNVQLVNDEQDLVIVAQKNFSREFLETFRRVGLNDTTSCGRAFVTRSQVVVKDIHEDQNFVPYVDAMDLASVRGCQSTPILARAGKVQGVLNTHYKQPMRTTGPGFAFIDLYARLAAAYIEA